MMKEAALSIISARENGLQFGRIDVPIPVTAGTELDDWPGGIKQKYSTLLPMLGELMKELNFSAEAMAERRFLPEGKDDAVGLWTDNGVTLVCFPTPESIEALNALIPTKPSAINNDVPSNGTNPNNGDILVLVNHQIFLNSFSKQTSKDFLESAKIIYMLEKLNVKGPKSMPVNGLMYRKYPQPFQISRRIGGGQYVPLKSFTTDDLPKMADVEQIFFDDSAVRDSDLSLFERLKRQLPNF